MKTFKQTIYKVRYLIKDFKTEELAYIEADSFKEAIDIFNAHFNSNTNIYEITQIIKHADVIKASTKTITINI